MKGESYSGICHNSEPPVQIDYTWGGQCKTKFQSKVTMPTYVYEEKE